MSENSAAVTKPNALTKKKILSQACNKPSNHLICPKFNYWPISLCTHYLNTQKMPVHSMHMTGVFHKAT